MANLTDLMFDAEIILATSSAQKFIHSRFQPQKLPRFLEGKAGAKSLYNQFGGVATECHILCWNGHYNSPGIKSSSY